MKLRHQIIGIGLGGAVVAAIVGIVGLLSAGRVADALKGTMDMSLAVQNSQRAAMMYGAIRADVQFAMIGAIGRDKVQVADAQKALNEHTESLNSSLKTLESLPLSSGTKDIVKETMPLVQRYSEAAANIVRLTVTDTPAAAAVNVPSFQKLFKELEAQMAKQVSAISVEERAFGEVSRAVVSRANFVVIGALVAATAILAFAALALARQLARPMSHAVDVSRLLARGDLTAKVKPTGNEETVQLLSAMTEMQHSFAGIVRDVKRSADVVAAASAEIAHGNQDLSWRTERQASSLEQTAAAMEQLSSTVKQNAEGALQAHKAATSAAAKAALGGDVVGMVVQTMQGIRDSAQKMSEIIELVDSIAAQTNILSLNAAVEAARAGEQGRGFAVVASDVRALAGRSADAAKEIGALIRASLEKVQAGSELVGRAGSAIGEAVTAARSVTDIVGEISAASSEQSAGVAEVSKAIADMDDTTQRNAALVEQIAASASGLETQAQELVQAVALFKLDNER